MKVLQNFVESHLRPYTEEIEKKESAYLAALDALKKAEAEKARIGDEVLNITRLYDITKRMSESLRFDDIFAVISGFMCENFTFSKIGLVLMERAGKGPLEEEQGLGVIKAAFEVDRNCSITKVSEGGLGYYEKYIEKAQRSNKAIVEGRETIVPLVVERSVIAVLLASCLQAADFDKFLILAAQFALQIKKVALYEHVQELSITDGLTGIYRRWYFEERLKEELERSKRLKLQCSLLIIDIDHFKKTNDAYGHLVGDASLKEIAHAIKRNIREVDMAGRLGGEEFGVVLPETGVEGAIHVADRIRAAVAGQKIAAYDEEVSLTVSIGIAAYPKDSLLEAEIVQKADSAMYRAKKYGRNRVVAW